MNNIDERATPRRLLTIAEAAALLNTTTRALYSRVARGSLPGVHRVGRSLRVDVEELLRTTLESKSVSL